MSELIVEQPLQHPLVSRVTSVANEVSTGADGDSVDDQTITVFRFDTWRFGWMAVALLVVSAHIGVRYLSPLLSNNVNLFFMQPALWLLPAALAMVALRRGRSRVFRTASDLLLLAVTVGLLQIAVSFLAGVFLGLGHSPYPHNPVSILRNFWYIGSMLVGREIARWYILKALHHRGEFISIGVTWLLFWLTSLPVAGYSRLLNPDSAFIYLGTLLIPAAAIHLLATYLALRGGPLASITYLGILLCFEWFSPVLPDLMWPVVALIGVMVPLLGLTILESQGQLESEDAEAVEDEGGIEWSWLAAAFLLVGILWFNTGVFGVRPAIVNGTSMLPQMKTGDLAITRDVAIDDLEIGDIIRFKQGSRAVLHRIIDIQEQDGEIVFIAQGDNNDSPDPPVSAAAVEGELMLHVPHAGMPGVYFKQALNWAIN